MYNSQPGRQHPIFITSYGLSKAIVIPSAAEESEAFIPQPLSSPAISSGYKGATGAGMPKPRPFRRGPGLRPIFMIGGAGGNRHG